MAFEYTPFTSESLTTAATSIQDLSPFADLSGGLPSGKQVIFFSIGFVCIIASIALISRALLGDVITPENVAKVAKVAAL